VAATGIKQMRIFITDSAHRQQKSVPVSDDLFVRPGRRTPRLPKWKLAQLKWHEGNLGFTEKGIPIGLSLDDRLDEAYEAGVRAGLDARRKMGTPPPLPTNDLHTLIELGYASKEKAVREAAGRVDAWVDLIVHLVISL
jgi:hypothetical protein